MNLSKLLPYMLLGALILTQCKKTPAPGEEDGGVGPGKGTLSAIEGQTDTDSPTFSPASASVYQLGNFGTARKKLKAWNP